MDSGFLSDLKKSIRERIIPWEGLARSGTISEDDASNIKLLEKSQGDQRAQVVTSQLDGYVHTLLDVLTKVADLGKTDVQKNVLTIINDLLLSSPDFLNAMVKSKDPYTLFVKVLKGTNDPAVDVLALYDLTILLSKAAKSGTSEPSKDVLVTVFDRLSQFIGSKDANYQSIAVQLLQDLVIVKSYKQVYAENHMVQNYKPLDDLITQLAKQAVGLQLLYNVLVTTWILSFSAAINKVLVRNYPDLIGLLLQIAKDLIKLKIVRISVAILRNFVEIADSADSQFKIIKLLMFNDAVLTLKVLRERKFAANSSDEELANDLSYLTEKLDEIVQTKLTSLDEYLTELENPNLLSWALPTHKSQEFWMENAGKFKDNNYKLVNRVFDLLADPKVLTSGKVILLNDIQFLIKNLGSDLITYINTKNGGRDKLLVMNLLENNNGDNELKYQALKTIQMLVGHDF